MSAHARPASDERSPDWTFDPLAVAWLRLIATVIIGLRLRQITDWLSRHLTPKGTR